MDVEQLIAEVHERPAIWQAKHKMHHNRGFIDTAWERIALALNTTKESARKKWKNLKDSYRKELRKIMKSVSGDEGGSLQLSSWPYFSMLDFLKDEIKPALMTGNLQKPPAGIVEDNSVIDEVAIYSELTDIDSFNYIAPANDDGETRDGEQPQISTAQMSRKRKESVQETVAKKMLLLEEKKLELLQNQNKQPPEDDSEDYHFLMSLLPHLKALEPLKKLRVRNKITQAIIDELSEL